VTPHHFQDEPQQWRESLCDRFAAAILMPKIEFHRFFDPAKGMTLELILAGSKYFQVSVPALVIRLRELRISSPSLIRLERNNDGGAGRALSTIGVGSLSDTYRLDLECSDGLGPRLRVLSNNASHVYLGEVAVQDRSILFMPRSP
jgi:hypothetical protein